MKKTREQNGITLIALIITIVVLLVLAVVAIRAVQDGGIIQHALNARGEHLEAQAKEKVMLALNEWKMEKEVPGATLGNFLTEKLGGENVEPNGDGTYTVTVDGYDLTVNAEGNITGITNSNNGDSGNDGDGTITTYTAYSKGDEVSIGTEKFNVIADSSATEESILLLAQQNINTETYVQAGMGSSVIFSEAASVASTYAANLGGTGRLLKHSEATELGNNFNNLVQGSTNPGLGYLSYWIAPDSENSNPYICQGDGGGINESTSSENMTGVRPVVLISKTLLTANDNGGDGAITTYTEYFKGDEVSIGSEKFNVIEYSNTTEENVLLLAQQCIDAATFLQAGLGTQTVQYSQAEFLAMAYADSLGGTGRLLKDTEASGLNDYLLLGGTNSGLGYLNYWVAADSAVYICQGETGSFKESTSSEDTAGVRPVVLISKNLLNAEQ